MCQIKCQKLADLQSVCIQCGSLSGWFLEELWVRDDTDDAWLCFPCHAWLTQADRYAVPDTNDVSAGSEFSNSLLRIKYGNTPQKYGLDRKPLSMSPVSLCMQANEAEHLRLPQG